MSRLTVGLMRGVPVFLSVVIALAAHRILPSALGPIPRLLITAALVLGMIWAFSQVTRRVDRRRGPTPPAA